MPRTKKINTQKIDETNTITSTPIVENDTKVQIQNIETAQVLDAEASTSIIVNENEQQLQQQEMPQETPQVAKKRGRKPKQKEMVNHISQTETEQTQTQENINMQSQSQSSPTMNENETNEEKEKEKQHNNIEIEEDDKDKVIKKRGRKPKGGKIIQQATCTNDVIEAKTNVILHLKCSIKDLYSNLFSTNIESFNFGSKANISSNCETLGSTQLENLDNVNTNSSLYNTTPTTNVTACLGNTDQKHEQPTYVNVNTHNNHKDYECDSKDIWKKLKQLEHNLHMNNISDKRSACFWCTYDFDNPPVYIPKHHIKDSYHVYGCFCSPECAAAHLMEENIDSSSKFERYYLLNHIYSKIYNYTKEIKPSPNPYYMLDKYYGNLTIQEYRALLRNERLFLIVDKPLTRILPELHEDNDDFIINNKIIPSNTYQVKKNVQKKTSSKSDIIHEKFGFA